MPIVQATTPTSAGFAQAFDTGGYAELELQKRREKKIDKEKKDKAIQDSIMDYNTKGVFKRDMPEVQRRIKDVQQFAIQNAEAIVNPSENMEVYQEFMDKQNAVKGLITYSIGAKEQYDKGIQMYLRGDGRFATDKNRDILYAYQQTPTAEQYADYTAFADPTQGFDRLVSDNAFNAAVKSAKDLVEDVPPEMEGQLAEGVALVTKGKSLDRAKVEEALMPMFDAKTVEGGDLRYQYGDTPEGRQRYIDDAMAAVNLSPEYATARTPTKSEKEPTAREMKKEAAVMFTDVSRQSTYETKLTESTMKGREGELVPLKYTTPEGEDKDSLETYGIATTGGDNSVMVFRPMKIQKNVSEGYDATRGEMLESGEGKRYKYQYPVERGNYIVADSDFELRYKKDGKTVVNRFGKGEAVPDLEQMKREGAITQNEFDDAIKNIKSQEGYMVYATNEDIDYFDLAEGGGESIRNMLKSGGMKLLMVPLESLDFEVDQALTAEFGVDQQWYMNQNPQIQQSEENFLDF